MKKIIKITLTLIMALALFGNCNIYAMSDPVENPDQYKPTINTNEPELETMAEIVLGVVSTIGTVISVIVIIIIGIKYMFGSVEEKAEYKKTMLVYLIGAFLLFSATTLPNILYKIGTSLDRAETITRPNVPNNPITPGVSIPQVR